MFKKVLFALVIAGGVAGAAPPVVVAQSCIEGCNTDFAGTEIYVIAARGWCYILRGCW